MKWKVKYLDELFFQTLFPRQPIMLLIGKDSCQILRLYRSIMEQLNWTTQERDRRHSSYFNWKRCLTGDKNGSQRALAFSPNVAKSLKYPPLKKRTAAHKAQSFAFLNEERRLINFLPFGDNQCKSQSVSRSATLQKKINKKTPTLSESGKASAEQSLERDARRGKLSSCFLQGANGEHQRISQRVSTKPS